MVFVFLGQAGTSVRGAYDVLVSIGVITYMVPYLFLFVSFVRLQREPAGADVVRVPGGRVAATLLAIVGFCTAVFAIVLSLVPASDEPHKILMVTKVLGAATVLIGLGVGLYLVGKAKRRMASGLHAGVVDE